MTEAMNLLEHVQGKVLVADSGYDSNEVRRAVRDKGMKPVIANGPGRKHKYRVPRTVYRKRYVVECFFHSLKRFRALATRYEKTARNYLALLHLACARIWLDN